MPQLLLQGFPDGAIKIGPVVSLLKKEDRVTYFVGPDSYFSHRIADLASERFAIATLIANGHVRASEVECSPLGIPYRTLMNWTKRLAEQGHDAFFKEQARSGGVIMTPAKVAECNGLLASGVSISATATLAMVKESTLRKALSTQRVVRNAATELPDGGTDSVASTKSERSQQDALAAEGMGTACTRAGDRMAAALGLLGTGTHFEPGVDIEMGGLLAGLPALCSNGLLSGIGRYLSLPRGFYSAAHILITLGFMALARLRRPEALRHVPPGELGRSLGLDRVPEVKTLRRKIALMAETGKPKEWMMELSKTWMEADPVEAGYLYVDGHIRVYSGSLAHLPRRYVSREKLCLRGTTDYWINDAIGRPFFVVAKAVTDGLATVLLDEIVPELLTSVPSQPTETDLAADSQLARFVMIFDREGSTHSLLSKLWEKRIGAITYRKAVKDLWPEDEFIETEVPIPGGGETKMKLATRETKLSGSDGSIPVLEVRRLTDTGHQTAIITTARRLGSPAIAGRMFSRWCQENYFWYMMEHYDIDGLTQYGAEELPGTLEVINPVWRKLDKKVRRELRGIRKLYSDLGKDDSTANGKDISLRASRLEDIQRLESDLRELRTSRCKTARKVRIDSLPENERPQQLPPLGKMLTDTVKMIAYRAETALVVLLRKHLAKEDEARAVVRELFVSAADIHPDKQENTLTIRIHRMASPVHDRATGALLEELTSLAFCHPETGMRLIYKLA